MVAKRGGLVVALTAATQLVCAPAHADDPLTVLASDGRQLGVGSVVAAGDDVDGVCHFADGATRITVVAERATSSAVELAVDDHCRLVVTDVSASPRGVEPEPMLTVPKHLVAASDRSRVGTSVPDVALDPPEQYSVILDQQVRDAAGFLVYEDVMTAHLDVRASGAVHGYPTGGGCAVSYPERIGNDVSPEPIPYGTDVEACWVVQTAPGPYHTSVESHGRYYRAIANVVLDERVLRAHADWWSSGRDGHDCDFGGDLPYGWVPLCIYDTQRYTDG